MAQACGAPVILDSTLRDGSLRAAAHEVDIPLIIYEAGEALRFSAALFHIAEFSRLGKSADSVEAFNERYHNGLPRLADDAFEPLTDDT